jgi:hypothetical protein
MFILNKFYTIFLPVPGHEPMLIKVVCFSFNFQVFFFFQFFSGNFYFSKNQKKKNLNKKN